MALYSEIHIPSIDDSKLDNDKEKKKIYNVLYLLQEQIKYMFSNIDEENVSKEAVTRMYNNTNKNIDAAMKKYLAEATELLQGVEKAETARAEAEAARVEAETLRQQQFEEIMEKLNAKLAELEGE